MALPLSSFCLSVFGDDRVPVPSVGGVNPVPLWCRELWVASGRQDGCGPCLSGDVDAWWRVVRYPSFPPLALTVVCRHSGPGVVCGIRAAQPPGHEDTQARGLFSSALSTYCCKGQCRWLEMGARKVGSGPCWGERSLAALQGQLGAQEVVSMARLGRWA